ncbi:MAG: type II toxin-antitoxin system VapC family toxin [Candidatus Saccharimonadales bacterium]
MPPILLDTHVVIWLYKNHNRIGKNAIVSLESTSQQLAVSYISIMEMAIKNATGKLNYDDKLWDDLAGQGIAVIQPNRLTVNKYQIFSPENKDPFDNLLIATALENGYSFMTADRKILSIKTRGLKLIDGTK